MITKHTCEMMVFCPPEQSPNGERECGRVAKDQCTLCGAWFCNDVDHGDKRYGGAINPVCRDCQED